MRDTLRIILGCASLLIGAVAAQATVADITLDCYTLDGITGYASADRETVAVGSGTDTDTDGFGFVDSGDTEMWCQFAVPYDYDASAGSPPTIRVWGYADSCVLCVPGVTCSLTPVVDLEISSRPYGNGDLMNASWSTADSAVMSWTSTSCGSPCSSTCWQGDVMKSAYAEATPDAGDWDIDQVVYIRIQRDNSVTYDLPAKFFLTQVRLQYTTR